MPSEEASTLKVDPPIPLHFLFLYTLPNRRSVNHVAPTNLYRAPRKSARNFARKEGMSSDILPHAAGASAVDAPAAAGAAVGASDSDEPILLPESTAAITHDEWKKSFEYVNANKKYGVKSSEAERLGISRMLYNYHFQRYEENGTLPKGSVGPPTRLPREAEQSLADWVMKCVENKTPVLPCQLQAMAKKVAVEWNVDPNTVGGEKWTTGFMRRFPLLTKRLPQQVEQIRVLAATTTTFEIFYDNLSITFPLFPPPPGKLYLTVNPEKVYNMDETAIMMKNMRSKVRLLPQMGWSLQEMTPDVPLTLCADAIVLTFQVIGVRGKDVQVLWRGQDYHVTLVACGNAAGTFLPPTLIFEGKRAKSVYIKDFPEAKLLMTISGWMEMGAYEAFARDFVAMTGGNCILIVDNHSTRKSLEALEIFLEHGVKIVTLPPHTTHLTQPLDVAFFRAFKAFFRKAITEAEGGGSSVSKYRLSGIVKKAWDAATAAKKDPVTGETATCLVSGFEATGIVPLRPSKVIKPDVVGLADRLQASRSLVALSTSQHGPAAAGAGSPTSEPGEDADDAILAPNLENDADDDAVEDDDAAPLISRERTLEESRAGTEKLLVLPAHTMAALKAITAKSTSNRMTSMTGAQLAAAEIAKLEKGKTEEVEKKRRRDEKEKEANAKKKKSMIDQTMNPVIPRGFATKGWSETWDDQSGPGLKVSLKVGGAKWPKYNTSFRANWAKTGKHDSKLNQ